MVVEEITLFEGNGRYRCIGPIGEGGMGLVYEVEDRRSGKRLALKTLRQVGPLELYLFKNEFRALADVSHPNLIGLYELASAGATPWFTMELLEGAVDLVHFLRGTGDHGGQTFVVEDNDLDPEDTLPPPSAAQGQSSGQPHPDEAEPGPSGQGPHGQFPQEAIAPLRDALGQLVDALLALHGAGKLHRDVKPRNILVTPESRVVLLDFGLVASLGAVSRAQPGTIAGSIPYMSPEQSLGAELTPASDWYAFGAVLYELLTGRPPFAGDRTSILSAKRQRHPEPPAHLVQGVPEDLNQLCMALLQREPANRPTGAEVRAALGRTAPLAALQQATFVGRVKELATFERAFGRVQGGKPQTLHVRGPSGMGKSALVEHALANLQPGGLHLTSRCYERDSLPFKAIDPLVDRLTQWLCEQPDALAATLAPRHIRALARLFPVIDRVPAFARAPERSAVLPDPSEQRRRALTALRELLARVAERQLLVIHLDDLQWADPDSHVALRELLREPDPPAMLLLLSYRDGYPQVEGDLLALVDAATVVEVGPLSPDEARTLARVQLDAPALVEHVAREAGGNPFYTVELARRAAFKGAPVALDAYITSRVAELPQEALSLLQAVALAAVPTRRGVALSASGASIAAITALQAGRLIRSEGPADSDRLECDHDRIREAIVEAMSPGDLTDCHLRLAEGLIAAEGDAERISNHLFAAGEGTRAAHYTRVAADQAEATLAFHRETGLVQRLLVLEDDGPGRAALLERLGRLLTYTGRGDAAANALLEAVKAGADPALEGEAARIFILTGNLIEGTALARRVMARVGAPIPKAGLPMLLSSILIRLRTRLRPLKARLAASRELSSSARKRLATMAGLAMAFMTSDLKTSWYLYSRFISEGLSTGDPEYVAYALTLEQLNCLVEPGGGRRSDRAFVLATELTARQPNRVLDAWLPVFRTHSLLQRGELKGAREAMQHASKALDAQPHLSLERGWIKMYEITHQVLAEGPGAGIEGYAELVADATERGDLALRSFTQLGLAHNPALFMDDPERAHRIVDEFLGLWHGDNDTQVFNATITRLQILMYEQKFEAAVAVLDQEAQRIKASGILLGGASRFIWGVTVARLYFGAWDEGLRPRGLRNVRRHARMLLKLGPLGQVWGRVWLGVLMHIRGESGAAETFQLATQLALQEGNMFHMAFSRWLEACAVGDEVKREEAEAWLGERGVAEPARYLKAWVPRLEPRRSKG